MSSTISAISGPSGISNNVSKLSPSFFLSSNKSTYYIWYLPKGQRCKMVIDNRNVYLLHNNAMIALKSDIDVPELLIGVTITGYYISRQLHTSTIDKDFFVTDTMYDMRDPYTEEEMTVEYNKVSTLREFITTFNENINGIYIIAQTLYGINLAEWGNRIDKIWIYRMKLNYPVVGLILYEREGNNIYEWRYYPTVTAKNGDRVVLEDLTMYNLSLPSSTPRITLAVEQESPRPTVLGEEEIGLEDILGAGITVPLWYIKQYISNIDRNSFLKYISQLDTKYKEIITQQLVLSPRQLDLFA